MVIIHNVVQPAVNGIVGHGAGVCAFKSRDHRFKSRDGFAVVVQHRSGQITFDRDAPHVAVNEGGRVSVTVRIGCQHFRGRRHNGGILYREADIFVQPILSIGSVNRMAVPVGSGKHLHDGEGGRGEVCRVAIRGDLHFVVADRKAGNRVAVVGDARDSGPGTAFRSVTQNVACSMAVPS